jgi:3-isopropylmalate/(R)-2-methylmalate dehydratase small subunit
MKLTGKVWKLGDGIRATHLLSSKYDKQSMSKQYDECAKHVLEDVDPSIAHNVGKGDILVAGDGFGAGHAHYYMGAVMGSKTAGFAAFFAESMNGLFQRAAIDFGLLAWPIPGLSAFVDTGDQLEVDLAAGMATNLTSGQTLEFTPVSTVIQDIVQAGGSKEWALKRVGADHALA